MKKNMNNELKIVSLFSGIGGFEEGIINSKLNGKVIFASEIDKYASKSYELNFGKKFLYGDVKQIKEESVPDHDFLCAGFPCQSFSIAGKQNGFKDTRGTLFFDVVRILKSKKPKYILLENVKNLISHDRGKTIRVILNVLQDLGYVVDFTVINSNEAGLPQNRERTYIIGILNGKVYKYTTDNRNKQVNTLKQELNKKKETKSFNFFDKVTLTDKKMCLLNILETNVEKKYYYSSEIIDDYLKNIHINYDKNIENKIIKILDLPREVHNDLERQRRVYSIYGISPTILARSDTTKILLEEKGNYSIRKLTPKETFLAQGFDENFIDNLINGGISDTQLYKQSGNAVSPPVITAIVDCMMSLMWGD